MIAQTIQLAQDDRGGDGRIKVGVVCHRQCRRPVIAEGTVEIDGAAPSVGNTSVHGGELLSVDARSGVDEGRGSVVETVVVGDDESSRCGYVADAAVAFQKVATQVGHEGMVVPGAVGGSQQLVVKLLILLVVLLVHRLGTGIVGDPVLEVVIVDVGIDTSRDRQPARGGEGDAGISVEPVAVFTEVTFVGRPVGVVDVLRLFVGHPVLVSGTVPGAGCTVRTFIFT